MEALLEREEEQVESWNDDRLDELSQTMKDGFAQINRKLDELPTREEVDQRFTAAIREMDLRFEAVHRETNQRFEATDRRIERVSTRFEHMVWATVAVAGGFVGNLFADKI